MKIAILGGKGGTGKTTVATSLAAGVARHFGIPAFVCINKYDLNPEVTLEIEDSCAANGYPVIGKIPFDPTIAKALQEFKTPVEAGN